MQGLGTITRSVSCKYPLSSARHRHRSILGTKSTTTTLRGILFWHWYRLWIPVLSCLCVTTRPIATWAYSPSHLHVRSPYSSVHAQARACLRSSHQPLFLGSNTMPRRSTRSRTTLLAGADAADADAVVPAPAPNQVAEPSSPKTKKAPAPAPVPAVVATLKSPAKKASSKKVPTKKKASSAESSSSSSSSSSSVKVKVKGSSATTASKKRKTLTDKEDEDAEPSSSPTSSSAPTKKQKSPPKKRKEKTSPAKAKAATKPKAADHQRITERDELPKLWTVDQAAAAAAAEGSYTFRIASWNVAGLRALVRKEPTALADFCRDHNLDVLCLQETKLQEVHVDDPKLKFRGCLNEAGYDDYWSCSTAKKGYSGTAVFVKQRDGKKKQTKQADIGSFFAPTKKGVKGASNSNGNSKVAPTEVTVNSETLTPTEVSYNIGKEIDNEGRTVIVEFPFCTLTNVYVPNAGQNLERLDFRTKEWDKDFLAFQQQKEKDRGLPVIWLGDLNIAHQAYDIWNDGAKHLAKQAGVTVQERDSFQEQLDTGYIDAFRKLHPEAKGHYSYWSQRAGNREPNKGLRLDYFVCSPELFSGDSKAIVRDSYMVPDRLGSDHSPVVLEIEIKKD